MRRDNPDTTVLFGKTWPWKRKTVFIVLGFFILLTLIKFLLAAKLSLHADEALHWRCSQFPALAYTEYPFMTALLYGLGTHLLGNSYLGARFFFLLLGILIPFLVYFLARPIVGERNGIYAALLSLCVPFISGMGILATPDVPLIIVTLLFLIAFENATRTKKTIHWVLTGLGIAAGFCTHYRFIVVVAGFFLYLILTSAGRRHWRGSGLWICLFIGAMGLIPFIWFNIENHFAVVQYQFVERPSWAFRVKGILYPVSQAIAVTPFLYIALIVALVVGIKRAIQGHDRYALLVCFSIVHLMGYFILEFVSDRKHFIAHWPLPGYLTLLVILPGVLRDWWERGRNDRSRNRRFRISIAIPLSVAGTLLMMGYLEISKSSNVPFGITRQKYYTENFVGWREMAENVRTFQAQLSGNKDVLIAGDNFKTTAELAFELGMPRDVYTLDHPLNVKYGREYQYQLWGLDERALRRNAGKDAIVVMEESGVNFRHRYEWHRNLCSMFDSVDVLDEQNLLNHKKRFVIFYGKGIRGSDVQPEKRLIKGACEIPAYVEVDRPIEGEVVSGIVNISGWAFDDAYGVSGVEILVDNKVVGEAIYGKSRPDVQRAYKDSTDPNHPHVGFEFLWNSRNIRPGRHLMAIRITTGDEKHRIAEMREIIVRHNHKS